MDLMYENTVDKIVEVLKNKKSTVFCGAGISLNSGLPLANNILSEILTKLEIPLNEIDTILNSNMPFEYFIETIKQETDIDALLQIFEQGVVVCCKEF